MSHARRIGRQKFLSGRTTHHHCPEALRRLQRLRHALAGPGAGALGGVALRAGCLVRPAGVKVGYEINFNRYFYKPKALRSLEEIRADLLTVEKEVEELLAEILGGGQR